MIDKNFYLENLSAFDILIEDDDRKQAEEVIFRVYSMLQRDKIWLREVATEDEIYEDDAELLEEVDEELQELDLKYDFHFDDFHKLVQQEMRKLHSTTIQNGSDDESDDEVGTKVKDEEDDDFFDEEDEDGFDDEDFFEEDEEDEDEHDEFSHLSDEELDAVTDYILESAKTRFNYPALLSEFPEADEDFVDGEFILPLIAGKAFGEADIEIAEKMVSSFTMLGYEIEMDDLIKMIEKKGKELGPEILAFKIAADSLHQGAPPKEVVQQISQLLRASLL